MPDDHEETISDEQLRDAIASLHDGTAEFEDVMCAINATFERETQIAPEILVDAIVGKYESDRDFANGGADQFVWNKGSELARRFGGAWRGVGAVENGELLVRLADELEAYRDEVGEEALGQDSVHHFLSYRKRVKGPEFGIPEPGVELYEAVVEWALEHAGEFTFEGAPTAPPADP